MRACHMFCDTQAIKLYPALFSGTYCRRAMQNDRWININGTESRVLKEGVLFWPVDKDGVSYDIFKFNKQ